MKLIMKSLLLLGVVTEGAARGYVDLIIGKIDGKRTLSLIDSQHTYTFTEVE